jgi:NADH:ubiquinone oxidoreductase subunit 2 (subunit N)
MAISSINLLNPSSLTTFLAWSSIGVSGQIICLLPSLNCGLSLMIIVIAYSMNFVAILATWQLKDYHSVYVICLIILFFALAGIPPLSMFIAKLWIIQVISPAYWLILLFILHWTINSIAYLKYIFQNI